MFAFLVLLPLTFSATPDEVITAKTYTDGIIQCHGADPRMFIVGDDMYTYVVSSYTTIAKGADVNGLRVTFIVPICSWAGPPRKEVPMGWPRSGMIEDAGLDGIIDVGKIDDPVTSASSLDFFVDVTGNVTGANNKAMWQSIYDRAIAAINANCRVIP